MQRLWPWLLCLLFIPFLARAESPPVYLEEIAWAGSSASTADEWFEICGAPGTDLSGWTISGASAEPMTLPEGGVIPESGVFLVANYAADDARSTLAAAPSQVTTAVALSNSALHLVLRDRGGSVVDEVGAEGAAPYAGTTGATKASMRRRLPPLPGGQPDAWETSVESSGFDAGATELGAPGSCAMAATGSATMTGETASAPSSPHVEPISAVRVSELYPIPRSGEEEWAEIVNRSTSTGEWLDGWTLEDGRGAKTALAGLLPPNGRLVIRSPKGNLNDGGDVVVLKDAWGRELDRVAYGENPSGAWSLPDMPKRGEALMRVEHLDEWRLTTAPTPGEANVWKPREEKAVPGESQTDAVEVERPLSGGGVSEVPGAPTPSVPGTSSSAPTASSVTPTASSVTPAKAGVRPIQDPDARRDHKSNGISAKKVPSRPRYKGARMVVIVASPPGIYAKNRWFALSEGRLREVRWSSAWQGTMLAGQKVTFTAQERGGGDDGHLLVNPKSILIDKTDAVIPTEVAGWPSASGFYLLRGRIESLTDDAFILRSGSSTGEVALPKSLASVKLRAGDEVSIESFVQADRPPQAVLARTEGLRLLRPAPSAVLASSPRSTVRMHWAVSALLTLAAAGVGLLAYLRMQRIERLRLARQAAFEDGTE